MAERTGIPSCPLPTSVPRDSILCFEISGLLSAQGYQTHSGELAPLIRESPEVFKGF